jgi:hypothetical protein
VALYKEETGKKMGQKMPLNFLADWNNREKGSFGVSSARGNSVRLSADYYVISSQSLAEPGFMLLS